jgi:hypothetical protein
MPAASIPPAAPAGSPTPAMPLSGKHIAAIYVGTLVAFVLLRGPFGLLLIVPLAYVRLLWAKSSPIRARQWWKHGFVAYLCCGILALGLLGYQTVRDRRQAARRALERDDITYEPAAKTLYRSGLLAPSTSVWPRQKVESPPAESDSQTGAIDEISFSSECRGEGDVMGFTVRLDSGRVVKARGGNGEGQLPKRRRRGDPAPAEGDDGRGGWVGAGQRVRVWKGLPAENGAECWNIIDWLP